MEEMSDRRAYLLRQQYEPGDRLLHPTWGIEQLHVVKGEGLTVSLRPERVPDGAGERSRAYLTVGSRTVFQPLSTGADGEPETVHWTLVTAGSLLSGPTTVVLPSTAAGTIDVGIETSTSAGFAAPDKTESRLPYTASPDTVTTITPGLGWVLAQFPTRSAWLASDVSQTIQVRVTPAAA